jgi:hypothetical protein
VAADLLARIGDRDLIRRPLSHCQSSIFCAGVQLLRRDPVRYEDRMFHKLVAVAAWALLAFIAFATLSPAGLRPELTSTEPALVVLAERFGAYGLLGLLFYLAYPRRIFLVCLLVFGAAIVLELLQLVIPDRDARIIDAFEKLAGGTTGVWAARAFQLLADRPGQKA